MGIVNFGHEVYGSGGGGALAPRQRFNFTLSVYPTEEQPQYFNTVRSATTASFSVEGSIMNQYNKKRYVQTRLIYEPVTVVFIDTHDNAWFNLMQNYLAFYYNDGRGVLNPRGLEGDSTVNINFETDLGFTLNAGRYFFRQIIIEQAGYYNGTVRSTQLINPIITSIQGDTLAYSDSNPVEWSITFQPESIRLDAIPAPSEDGIERASNGPPLPWRD